MDRVFFAVGCLSAAVAVTLGAFGAHGLRGRLVPDMLLTFEIGVRYQMYHALALLFVAWAATRWPGGAVHAAGWAFLVGVLATLAIFLPSFVFVALSHPLVPRIRASPAAAAFLDGVNVAALGLMVTVTWQLARSAIADVTTAVLAVVAAVALIVFRVNSAWLVLGGAVIGVVAMR